ncbi:MAG: transposase [Comamonadaceae bacterium]|nr:MAG: transposase [Comamonadaceae bacterium]
MLKALLLPAWRDPPNVKLAKALDERASAHRFCGFLHSEGTPERTAFMRYRGKLVAQPRPGLAQDSDDPTQNQGDHSQDPHKCKPAVDGSKAHVGVDATSDLVEKFPVTSANLNHGRAGPDALPDDPGEVFAHRRQHRLVTVKIGSGGTSRP